MLSLITLIIVLGILIVVHELGHFMAAKRLGVRVEKFSLGFGPKIFSSKRGETEYILSAVPLGGYVKLAGDDPLQERQNARYEYLSRTVSERGQILLAGPVVNYIAAFLLFSAVFMVGNPTYTTEIGGLLPDYPAKASGLAIGDRIVTIDGVGVKYWEDLTSIIYKKVDSPVRLKVERGRSSFEVEIEPKVRVRKDIFGNESRIALIGIMPSARIESVRYGFVESFAMGFKKLIQLTAVTYKVLWAILTGKLSLKDSMTGPLGIFVITGKAVSLGFIYIIHLMAVLSASLAIFNLLPIPVLDGGHIMFLIIEKLKGSPLKARTQEVITNLGLAFLVVLMVYIFYADIVRFQLIGKMVKLLPH